MVVTCIFRDNEGGFAIDNVAWLINRGHGVFEVHFMNDSQEIYEETEFIGMEVK